MSFGERLRMTWELSWPLAAIDLGVVLLIHGVIDAQGEALDSAWAVAAFFIVSPWVVRRALARRYGSCRVVVVSGEQDRARLQYQQSLKVMWLLAWRSSLLGLGALLLVSGVLRLLHTSAHDLATPGPLVNALGLSAVDALTSLLFFPFLIPGMLRKRFRSFHLEWRPVLEKQPQKRAPGARAARP